MTAITGAGRPVLTPSTGARRLGRHGGLPARRTARPVGHRVNAVRSGGDSGASRERQDEQHWIEWTSGVNNTDTGLDRRMYRRRTRPGSTTRGWWGTSVQQRGVYTVWGSDVRPRRVPTTSGLRPSVVVGNLEPQGQRHDVVMSVSASRGTPCHRRCVRLVRLQRQHRSDDHRRGRGTGDVWTTSSAPADDEVERRAVFGRGRPAWRS